MGEMRKNLEKDFRKCSNAGLKSSIEELLRLLEQSLKLKDDPLTDHLMEVRDVIREEQARREIKDSAKHKHRIRPSDKPKFFPQFYEQAEDSPI